MTEYFICWHDEQGNSKASKPVVEKNIIDMLSQNTLDPRTEEFGGAIDRLPFFSEREESLENTGIVFIEGVFPSKTKWFRVLTDDEALIARVGAAVQENMSTPKYREAIRKYFGEKGMHVYDFVYRHPVTGEQITKMHFADSYAAAVRRFAWRLSKYVWNSGVRWELMEIKEHPRKFAELVDFPA